MAKKKTDKQVSKEQHVQVPIKWNVPDALNSIYANNMLVQILEHEIKLLFFETKPSTRIKDSDPIEKEVRADCVASIIVSPAKLPALIGVMQSQLEVLLRRQGFKLDQNGRIIPNEPKQPF